MEVKRRKINQPVSEVNEKTDFLSMNDDCISKTFEWLELDDICSLSDTCKKLKVLASDYFQRKHKNKLLRGLRIIAVNGKIQPYPNEKCMQSFSRCFDTVIVNAKLGHNIDAAKLDLSLFIRENCSKYLSLIQFQSMVLYDSIGDNISSVLENVETVAFSACKLDGTYHQILKHCHNLKHLIVEEDYGRKIEQLLLQTYPKLVHFDCRYYGRVMLTKNLEIFLRQHPNLKRLTWCFHARIREAAFSDKTLECIDMIVRSGKNLTELFLSFDGTYNLNSICDKLKVLCDRKQFKRLEMDFRFTTMGYKLTKMMLEHGHLLANLKSLQGLYLRDFSDYGSSFLPTLSTMENLRILQLDVVSSIKRLSEIPLGGLLNLEELHIGLLMHVKLVQKFICEVRTLKIISILRCKSPISTFKLPTLNEERKKILSDVGDSELIIYLDVGEKNARICERVEGDVIKIEFYECQINNGLNKPFVQEEIIKRW